MKIYVRILSTFLLFLSTLCIAKVHHVWTLNYRCEADFCKEAEGEDEQSKDFATKQEAIDWANGNYQYIPETLEHGKFFYTCDVDYISPDNTDPITSLRKDVKCNKKDMFLTMFSIRNTAYVTRF